MTQAAAGDTDLLAEPQESDGVSLSPEAACAIHTAGPGREEQRGDGEQRARARERWGSGAPSLTARQATAEQGGVGMGHRAQAAFEPKAKYREPLGRVCACGEP